VANDIEELVVIFQGKQILAGWFLLIYVGRYF